MIAVATQAKGRRKLIIGLAQLGGRFGILCSGDVFKEHAATATQVGSFAVEMQQAGQFVFGQVVRSF